MNQPGRIDEIAAAVVDLINGGRWPERVLAEKVDRTTLELSELANLRIHVVTGSTKREAFTRGAKRREYEIQIGFRQHLPADEAPRILALKRLVELMAEAIDDNQPFPTVIVDSVTDSGPSIETINDYRTYLQVITATYYEFS